MSKKWPELQQEYKKKSAKFDKELLKLRVVDSGEPLVEIKMLSTTQGPSLMIDKNCSPYLRQSVAAALIKAAKYFDQRGYTLKVESAYRSLNDQMQRFERRYKEIKAKNSQMSHADIIAKANTFTAGTPVLAAHTAAAAVDVTLLDATGAPVDFGVPYRHGDVESVTNFPHITKAAKVNRQLLKKGMEVVGFVNYPYEYWHYSIGDVCAAYINGQQQAVYGPVEFDPQTKKQTLWAKGMIYKPFIESK